jgi:hypothetical protein
MFERRINEIIRFRYGQNMKKHVLAIAILVVMLSLALMGCAKGAPKPLPQPSGVPSATISGGSAASVPAPSSALPAAEDNASSSDTFQSGLPLKVNEPVDASTLTSAVVTVKGRTQPGATLNVNDQIGKADDQGNFNIPITLDEGLNAIDVIASDSNSDNEGEVILLVNVDLSQASSSVLSSVSSSIPEDSSENDVPLKVLSPQDGADVNAHMVTVTGQTVPGATVCINDQVSMVDSSGKFSISVDLSAGLNAIDVISIDDNGNQNEILLMVNGTSGS